MSDSTPKIVMPSFDWQNRRRWIWASTAFCMLVISYCLHVGSDARLYETALNASFILLGSIGGAYIAGSAWEHGQLVKNTKNE